MHHALKSSVKPPSITGLKKNRRSLPVAVCRSCETLDGTQNIEMWPRSHSLDDLQGESSTDLKDISKKVNSFPQDSLDASKKTTDSVLPPRAPMGCSIAGNLLPKQSKGAADFQKGKAKELVCSATETAQFLPKNCEAHPTLVMHTVTRTPLETHSKGIRELERADYSPVLKEGLGAEQKGCSEARMQPKNPSQPPPVPAKKSRERLSNGLYHSSMPLSPDAPSLPVKKTIPSIPIDCRGAPASRPSSEPDPGTPPSPLPPWLSELPETASVQQHVVKLGPVSARKISCTRGMDLEMLIDNKLQSEEIDLTEEPYSDKVWRSHCFSSLTVIFTTTCSSFIALIALFVSNWAIFLFVKLYERHPTSSLLFVHQAFHAKPFKTNRYLLPGFPELCILLELRSFRDGAVSFSSNWVGGGMESHPHLARGLTEESLADIQLQVQ